MAEHYRVWLADGQVVEIAASPAVIRRMHPTARIQGRVVVDELGQGHIAPFQGEQPVGSEAPSRESMTVVQLREEIERRGLDKPPADAKKADLIATLEANPPGGTIESEGEKGQP